MSKIVQYSPISDDDDVLNQYENIFMIKVRAFSEDQQLLEDFLEESPPWLEGKDDKRGYLKEHVYIQIFEKLEFIPGHDFVGFKLGV